MSRRKQFTVESNYDKIAAKIEEKPHRVLNEIGLALVKEIRPQVNVRPASKKKGTPFMKWNTQFWARRIEKDLIIGYKDFSPSYKYDYDSVVDPIKPTVIKNLPKIQSLITKALDEIRKERG